jgi:4,5-DOPA dioxygenase extradiol
MPGMDALPSLFISHGSPMTAIEPGPAGHFMTRLGPALSSRFGKPKAVLAVSAHSLARRPVLLAGARHEAVHDFGGFPDELYRLRYDAPGAPSLAPRVAALLAGSGIAAETVDHGGLDHGIWTPLRYVFPDADVPVLPLAFVPGASPAELFALGEALAPLADEGVLVMGSGSLTHNLRLVFQARATMDVAAPEIPESRAFRAWVHARSAAADWPALLDYRRQAPHAAYMHPTDEHWLPFYVAAGVGGREVPPRRLHDSVTYGSLAMDAYAFGAGAAALEAALAEGEPRPA